MKNQLYEIFKSADRISEVPNLRANNKPRFQSVGGGLATIGVFILVAVQAYFQLMNYLTMQVESASRDMVYFKTEALDYRETRFVPVLYVNFSPFNTPSGMAARLEDLFYLEISLFFNIEMTDGTIYIALVSTSMVQCSQLPASVNERFYGINPTDLRQSDTPRQYIAYCVNGTDAESKLAELLSEYSTHATSKLNSTRVNIFPCDPSLSTVCSSVDDRTRTVNILMQKMKLGFPNFLVDFANSNNPAVQLPQFKLTRTFELDEKYQTYFSNEFYTVLVEDDRGFPHQRSMSKKFWEVMDQDIEDKRSGQKEEPPTSCTSEQREETSCRPYATMDFGIHLSDKQWVVRRRLKHFTEALSNIGGFYSVCMLIVTLVHKLACRTLVSVARRKLIGHTFGVKKITSGWLCCRKSGKDHGSPQGLRTNYAQYKAAKRMVEESLDVYSLVRQLCLLKALLGFMVDKTTQEQVPSCLMRIEQRKMQTEAENKPSTSALREPYNMDSGCIESLLVPFRSENHGDRLEPESAQGEPNVRKTKENDEENMFKSEQAGTRGSNNLKLAFQKAFREYLVQQCSVEEPANLSQKIQDPSKGRAY